MEVLYQRYFLRMNQNNMTSLLTLLIGDNVDDDDDEHEVEDVNVNDDDDKPRLQLVLFPQRSP